MYDSILVPVDGSDAATAAIERALSLAVSTDATLSLLSVVNQVPVPMGEEIPANPTRAALDEQSTKALERAESKAIDAGLDFRTTVERGIPHEEIADHVDENNIDLVAMGTHGRTGLQRYLLGSVTERTLRTSDVPVLTTQKMDEAWSIDDILVPTDGSEAASEAANHAFDVAMDFDATVHVLSVVDTKTLAAAYGAGVGMPEVIKTIKEDSREDVEAVRDRALAMGLECETAVLEGAPSEAITDHAEDIGADVVAIGTHGRSGLDRLLLGSITERTVRTSPAPVLTIPVETE